MTNLSPVGLKPKILLKGSGASCQRPGHRLSQDLAPALSCQVKTPVHHSKTVTNALASLGLLSSINSFSSLVVLKKTSEHRISPVCMISRLNQLTAHLVSAPGCLTGILNLTWLNSSSANPILPQIVSRHLLEPFSKIQESASSSHSPQPVLRKSWQLHLQRYQSPFISVSTITTTLWSQASSHLGSCKNLLFGLHAPLLPPYSPYSAYSSQMEP